MKTLILVCYLSLTCLLTLVGQNKTHAVASPSTHQSELSIKMERSIILNLDSKSDEILIQVEEHISQFSLTIETMLTAGKVNIELFDPKGRKQGNFQTGPVSSVLSESARGQLDKREIQPEAGQWRIKVSPNQAIGQIRLRYNFHQH